MSFENEELEGPAWTPDGRELVFSSGGHFGARRIKRVMVDPSARGGKSESRPLPVGEQATTLNISRSGRLVYSREIRDSNIWKLDVPASAGAFAKPVRLISSTLDDQSPDYSPDGKKIAFASTRSGTEEIWVANADGSNSVQLTAMGGPPTSNPQWSPDGRTNLFKSRREGSSGLKLMDPSTGSGRRLTDDP